MSINNFRRIVFAGSLSLCAVGISLYFPAQTRAQGQQIVWSNEQKPSRVHLRHESPLIPSLCHAKLQLGQISWFAILAARKLPQPPNSGTALKPSRLGFPGRPARVSTVFDFRDSPSC